MVCISKKELWLYIMIWYPDEYKVVYSLKIYCVDFWEKGALIHARYKLWNQLEQICMRSLDSDQVLISFMIEKNNNYIKPRNYKPTIWETHHQPNDYQETYLICCLDPKGPLIFLYFLYISVACKQCQIKK